MFIIALARPNYIKNGRAPWSCRITERKSNCSVRQREAKQNKAKKTKHCRARHTRQHRHSTATAIVERRAHDYTSTITPSAQCLPTPIHRRRKLSAATAAACDLQHAEQNIGDGSTEKHTTLNYDSAPNNHLRVYKKAFNVSNDLTSDVASMEPAPRTPPTPRSDCSEQQRERFVSQEPPQQRPTAQALS